MRDTLAGKVMPAVVAEATVNPEMRAVLAAFVHDRRKPAFNAISRAVARGELPDDTDIDLVLDLLGGLVYFRVMLADDPPDDAVVATVVDTVLAGIGPAPSR
jgi:hypothetical protein